MDDSKNLYSTWMWVIKDEHFLEAGYPEDSFARSRCAADASRGERSSDCHAVLI
jgi:hypothetical protein